MTRAFVMDSFFFFFYSFFHDMVVEIQLFPPVSSHCVATHKERNSGSQKVDAPSLDTI